MRETLEFWLVLAVAKTLGRIPRGLARIFAELLAIAVYSTMAACAGGCAESVNGTARTLSGTPGKRFCVGLQHLGWQLVEFCA